MASWQLVAVWYWSPVWWILRFYKEQSRHAITNLSSDISIPTDSLSTHPDSQQIAAEVNGEIITIDEWYRSVALEQALNNLAGQPPSSPEAVLERLINEKITLQVNQSAQTPAIISSGEAEVRLHALMKSWNIDEAELNSALSQRTLNQYGWNQGFFNGNHFTSE